MCSPPLNAFESKCGCGNGNLNFELFFIYLFIYLKRLENFDLSSSIESQEAKGNVKLSIFVGIDICNFAFLENFTLETLHKIKHV